LGNKDTGPIDLRKARERLWTFLRKMFLSLKGRASAFRRLMVQRETLYGLAAVYLGMFGSFVFVFAEHIRNEVIYEIALVFLTIEGILFGMISQLEERRISKVLAVVVGLLAMMVTVATLAIARFQQVQLGYSSYLSTTYLFLLDGEFFIIFILLFAVGLLPVEPKDPGVTEP